jgi:hypothetical protein
LDKRVFSIGSGSEVAISAVEMCLVSDGVFGSEKDGATGKSRFDGIHGGFRFSFSTGGTGRVLGIGTVGFDAGGGGIHNWLTPFL